MIPNLIIVALEFYREPRRLFYLRDPRTPLPQGMTELLAAPKNELGEKDIAQTAATLNATVQECREIVPFFIKQVLLNNGGDYYRVLGLSHSADANLVKRHYHYLIRLFHPDRDVRDDSWDELYAPRINEAYATLRNPEKRRVYDASLKPGQDDRFASMLNRYMQQPKQAAPAQNANPQPSTSPPPPPPPQSTGKSTTMSPLAKKVAAGLGAVVIVGFAVLINLQSQQPTLRIESGIDSSRVGNSPVYLPPKEAKAETEVQTADSIAHLSGQPDTTPLSNTPTLSIEEQIRAKVEQATVAVIGHRAPPKPEALPKPKTPPKPEAVPKPRPLTVATIEPSTPVNDGAEKTESVESVEKTVAEEVAKQSPREIVLVPVKSMKPAPSQDAVAQVLPVNPVPVEREIADVVPARMVPEELATVKPEAVKEQAAKASPIISPEQMSQLIASMVSRYEAGDLQAFVALFAEHAKTTDANGRDAIYAIYKPYFKRPERRKMTITDFHWQSTEATARSGSGTVFLVSTPFDGSDAVKGGGTLELDVDLFPDGLRITGMFYKTSKR